MTAARAAYRFFVWTLALLIGYTLVSLIAGLKFLPGDLTQNSLPYHQVSAFATALLDLAVLGGLLGGGIVACRRQAHALRSPTHAAENSVLRLAVLIWSLLVIGTVAAGILNLVVALAPVFAVAKIAVIGLVIAAITPDLRAPIPLIWTTGMIVIAVCAALSLVQPGDYRLAAVLGVLVFGATVYLGYVLAAVALVFWLMHRFSDVTPLWAGMSLYTVAGLLALAGALVTLSGLTTLGFVPDWLGWLSAVAVPLLYLIFASHTYRAFANRNPTNTLAAHWTALGVLLLVLGVGVLGGLQVPLRQWTAGTRLSDLQPTLALLAVVAISLGVLNQTAAEMRGHNRRVTGLAPFWLVVFGSIGGGLALAGAGLVQVYLERVLSIGYVDVQALIAPLYALWVGGLALLALGVMLYTLVFWLRRPRP